jgi:lipooligosaccharide transport system ATP-binding protein
MAPVVSATGLVKSYGERRVVNGLSLHCDAGAVLGLLGPNGAGKTTTLRMLYGLLDPEAGTIEYGGASFASDRDAIRRRIGVCTQEDTIDYDFSVEQNLRVYASYFRPRVADVGKRVDELLAQFGLEKYRSSSPRELSGGYKQRLMIARSVVHSPSVLFLDEPTTGLDPSARVEVWELIASMRARGLAVILTTHYMDEAERLSDSLLVLREGEVAAEGSPREIVGRLLGDHVVVLSQRAARMGEVRAFAERLGRAALSVLDEVRIPVTKAELGEFSKEFADQEFKIREPSLDDLFLVLARRPGAQ